MNGFMANIKELLLRGNLHRAVLSFLFLLFLAAPVFATGMPEAPGSPIAGITFDDRPLILPIQRNFQMAMLTASSELSRSCGRIESYGWRLEGNEQKRVNQIFNNTVDRIRAQGFVVEVKHPKSLSRDVTLFTADTRSKHLLFLWSAGDIGLVMVLCETSAPLLPIADSVIKKAEAIAPANFPAPFEPLENLGASRASRLSAGSGRKPMQLTRTGKPKYENFSPLGSWSGSYTCSQGTTGATFEMKSLTGDHFEGVFRFYPTAKNPYVSKGSYAVFGEYDKDSQRILLNPGEWIDRPKGYQTTIMIGSFDPIKETFSAFFQGIMGCTSYEAHFDGPPLEKKAKELKKKKSKKKKAKVSKKKKKKKVLKAKKAKVETSKTKPAAKTKPVKKKEAVKTEVPKLAAKVEAAPAKTAPIKPTPTKAAPAEVKVAPVKAAPKAAPVKEKSRTSSIEPPTSGFEAKVGNILKAVSGTEDKSEDKAEDKAQTDAAVKSAP